ncbi:MAG: NAD-dependent epimerase/dehydratase family protein, partial [Bacilli bacterium]|nr:NAD-dependent epimerase/dehydratase family protein [Bacilli bacterium]
YGVSKKMAEDELFAFSKENGHPVYVYRFHNVFGKWCKPNYNSVIATWCYNVSHDLPIEVNESNPAIDFVYIDDIVKEIVRCIKGEKKPSNEILYVEPVYNVHLFDVRDALYSFRDSRKTLDLPLLKPGFFKDLYSTYLSYIEPENYVYDLNMHCDNRGSFTEMLHMDGYGQVSVNIAHPGIVKGNHYHNSKNEKYIVVSGSADIKLRKLGSDEVITFHCDGSHLQVVDIPPGYTHSIMATGNQDAVTVMWANEPFDPQNPDTIMEMVER